MYKKTSWFGTTIEFDGRTVRLGPSPDDVIEMDDVVEDVATTHCHVAILMANGTVGVRRIDDEGSEVRILKSLKLDGPERILISTSKSVYLVRQNAQKTSSEVVRVLEDSEDTEDSEDVATFPWPVQIVQADAGNDFVIYRDSRGNVFSMGTGTRGELGVGLIRRCAEPVHVEQLAGLRVTKIACGGWHTVALTEGGDVYAWGWNRNGQLGKEAMSTEVYPILVDPTVEFDCAEENVDDIRATEHTTRVLIKTCSASKEDEFVLGDDTVPINGFACFED